MDRVGFAIIGLGSISEVHARAISMLKNGYLRGVYSRSLEKGMEFSSRHGDPVVYSDIEYLLEDEGVDVAVITTPSSLHMDYALEALKRGKSVIVEKPLEINEERGQAIIDTAEREGAFLTVIFQSRFMEAVNLLKRAIEEGRFGKIALVETSVDWNRSSSYYQSAPWRGTLSMDGGGVMMNQTIHTIDMMLYLLGPWKSAFSMKKNIIHKIEGEDTEVSVVEFENGALGVISATTAIYPENPRKLSIYGENGSVTIEDDFVSKWVFKDQKDYDSIALSLKRNGDERELKSKEEYFKMIYEDFIKAIETGRDPRVAPRSALEPIKLIKALYKSADEGKSVYNPNSK